MGLAAGTTAEALAQEFLDGDLDDVVRTVSKQLTSGSADDEREAARFAAAVVASDEGLDRFIELVERDTSGAMVHLLAGVIAPELLAELLVDVVDRGALYPDLLITALTAAVLKRRDDLVDRVLPHVGVLDPKRLTKIAAMAERHGQDSLAEPIHERALDGVEPVALRLAR